MLNWTAASELHNAGYEVQVSLTSSPVGFRALGFVVARSSKSQTARTYGFRDQKAGKTGLRYNHLHQVDLDGMAIFSPMCRVAFGAAAGPLAAVSNPFSNTLALLFNLPQAAPAAPAATLILTDALGRAMLPRV